MTPRIPTFARPLALGFALPLALAAGLAWGSTAGVAEAAPIPVGAPVISAYGPAVPGDAAAQAQDERLPSAEAGPRMAFLPALRYLENRDTCDLQIAVMNLGSEPSKAVLVAWGLPSNCPPQAAGPLKIECTGLLAPGSSWILGNSQVPTGSKSGALYSFTTRKLSDIGVDLGFDDVVADFMCETLFFGIVGDADDQRRFQKAFNSGESFAGVPMAKAYGGPLAVEVDRACDGVALSGDPTLIGSSAYEGVSGRQLGVPTAAGMFEYAVPSFRNSAGIAKSTLMVQNAGLDCATVQLFFQERGRCSAPTLCELQLAPGESESIDSLDLAACGMTGDADSSAWIESNQPLAVAVDTREEDTLSTYAAPAANVSAGAGALPGYARSTVGYAPLIYNEFGGWATQIQVQNADTLTEAEVKVYFLDRSGDIITMLKERICPRGSASFVLGQVADLPGNWVGSVRVESQEWWAPSDPREAAPEIHGVVELLRRKDGSRVSEAFSYNLVPGETNSGPPATPGKGPWADGVGVIAIPQLIKGSTTQPSSELAIANVVGKPGFTDFAIYLYDQNGLLDFICQKLHDRQVEYIDLTTWGFINPGFKGSAVISAVFWEHDVFSPTGDFVRNLVGLAAVSAARAPFNPGGLTGPRFDGDDPGDASLGIAGIPLRSGDGVDFLSALPGFSPRCPGIPTQPGESPTPPPTSTPAPTRTPRPTVAPTAGSSPTPRPTAQPLDPLGIPPAPPVHLPMLNFQGQDDVCRSWIKVQLLGDEPAKAVLVAWGEPEFCPPQAKGPLKVECTGLIGPGGSWLLSNVQIPTGSKSGVLFSFTNRTLAEVGIDPASTDTVADFMCETLFFDVVGDAVTYGAFKKAYHNGTEWSGIPLAKTYGPPLAVNVLRTCPGDVTPGVTANASYNGLTELGAYDAIQGGYGYFIPLVYSDKAGFTSQLYLQNAGVECMSIELWFKAQDDCLRMRICDVTTLAPGESFEFDASDCQGPDWQGSAWIRSSQPLAIGVDIVGRDLLMSYEGTPHSFSHVLADGSLSAYSSGSPVAFGPLIFSEYQGWDTGIQVQNIDPTQAANVKVYFLDRSGDIITTLVDWVCPRGSQTFFLPVIHDLPGNWAGSVRVESQEWWTPDTTPEAIAEITGVITLMKFTNAERAETIAAVAYNLLSERQSLAWGKGGEGEGAGGLATGTGLIALPLVVRSQADGTSTRTDIAITNLVKRNGYTDYSFMLFDANGLADTLCQRIHASQVDYIDLDRWGHIAPGFVGSALVSAGFWQHEVRDATGDFVRNLVGLGAVVVDHSGGPLAATGETPGDQAAASTGFALGADDAARLAGTLAGANCPRPDVAPSPPAAWPDPAGPPKVHLPVLRAWGDDVIDETSTSDLTIQNLGAEPSKAILLTFEGEGACAAGGAACAGPSTIECTGLLAPGGTWQIAADKIPPHARSGIVYSLSARTTTELGIPRPVPAVVADVICDALRSGVVGAAGDCAAFDAFQNAYQGGIFADIPLNKNSGAWGAPIAVQVLRAFPGSPNPAARITSAYTGLDAATLGEPTPPLSRATRWEFGLPIVHLGGGDLTSLVYIQNAGLECSEVELWLTDPGACDTPPRKCAAFSLAPGQARAVDASTCVSGRGGDEDASGWVRATGPSAVAVESSGTTAENDSLLTYTARPRYTTPARGGQLPQPAGSAVAFAPLIYSEYQHWEHTIHAMNLDLNQPAKVKVTFLDRSGDIIGSLVEWICPGGAKPFFLPRVAGLPGNWIGSARIESMAYRMSDGTWRDPPPIQAVAEMTRWLTDSNSEAFLGNALAYECLAEPEALDWSNGSGSGGLSSGIGVIALPGLTKAKGQKGVTSEIAIANLVSQPGYTDFAVLVFDPNGLTDVICQKLHDRQVEYIDLATWGLTSEGFVGSMVISAVRWSHTYAEAGGEIRDLVGLGAVLIQRSNTVLGEDLPGDEAAAITGIPLTGAAAQALAGLYTGTDPCPIPPTPTPEPATPTPTTRPLPTATGIEPTATAGASPTIQPTATMSTTVPTRVPPPTSTPVPPSPSPTAPVEARPTAAASPTTAASIAVAIRVCPGLDRRVPAGILASRLGQPESLAGWGERCNPALPASPWNGLRRSLTLSNPARGYQPVYNDLVLRCGCR